MFFLCIFFSMRRIKLKKKRIVSPLTFILIIIFLFVISLIVCFRYIGVNLSKKVEEYGKIESKKIISYVINKSITDDVINNIRNDLFVEKNNVVDFNSANINKLVALINRNLKSNLNDLEKGKITLEDVTLLKDKSKIKKGVIYEIPTGIIFNNALLSNIGPKIPVKLHLIGDILVSVSTKVNDYGINNAIVELDINITITEQMVLPFSTKEIKVEESIPIAIKMIQGSIPNYYSSNRDIPLYLNGSSN